VEVAIAEWQCDVQRCADCGQACDGEGAVARFDPVEQSSETGSVSGVRTAGAVVVNLDRKRVAFDAKLDCRAGGLCVFDHVCECFGDDEVCGRLEVKTDPRCSYVDVDGHGISLTSDSTAVRRPPRMSEAGRMPRTRSRSSLLARSAWWIASSMSSAVGRPLAAASLAIPSARSA
jgi:hypothetical protein